MQMVDCTITVAQYNTALQLVLRLKRLVRTLEYNVPTAEAICPSDISGIILPLLRCLHSSHPYSVYVIIPDLLRSTPYVH